MGLSLSKLQSHKKRLTKVIETDPKIITKNSNRNDTDEKDLLIIETIKTDLNENVEIFVLNNVLMCTFFCKNYYEGINDILQGMKHLGGNIIQSDTVLNVVNENVIYRPIHGPRKQIAESLISKKVFVPIDLFKVYNVMDEINVKNSDENGNKVPLKVERGRQKGCVRLRCLNFERGQNVVFDYSNINDKYLSKAHQAEPDSKAHRVPKQTKINLADCFSFRKVKKQDIDMLIEDMNRDDLIDEDIYDEIPYLTADVFTKHFQKFYAFISHQLGLTENNENYKADSLQLVHGRILYYYNNCELEVVPCLNISWPQNFTTEFNIDGIYGISKELGKNNSWPNKNILQQIQKINCVLVPNKHSKGINNTEQDYFNWEFRFLQAENLLECTLRLEQVKCYLILLILFKEYLEPLTKWNGIIPDHFRTLIFHETAEDYNSWPEHRLGVKLMKLIEILSSNLHNKCLRDYFIRERNVFRCVSQKDLQVANEFFHKLKQQPLMIILRALRNVRYANEKFYPPLNYSELLDILHNKNQKHFHEERESVVSESSKENTSQFTAEQKLFYSKYKKTKKNKLARKKSIKPDKPIFNYTVCLPNVRRESIDSIRIDWQCQPQMSRKQKSALLKYFINNFLEIAEVSSQISTKKQYAFYVKQAWYLMKILDEEKLVPKTVLFEISCKIKNKQKIS